MSGLRERLERLTRRKWALPAAALAVAVVVEIALEILYESTAGDREGGLISTPLFWALFGAATVVASAGAARLAVRAGLLRELGYYGGGEDDEAKAREESE